MINIRSQGWKNKRRHKDRQTKSVLEKINVDIRTDGQNSVGKNKRKQKDR